MTVQAEILAAKERELPAEVPTLTRVEVLPAPIESRHARSAADMAEAAMMRGAADAALKFWDLHQKMETENTRKSYAAALAAAKAKFPVILKNRVVDFTSQKGRTNYRFEDLAEIASKIDGPLSECGLSYRYRTTNADGVVTVTCIVSHRDGYSEENTMSAGYDSSGNKNSIQSIGSTVTYLQRYTLKAALGLAVSSDDDGQDAGRDGGLSADQADALNKLIGEIGEDNRPRFLKYMGVEKIEDIPVQKFEHAVSKLESKRATKTGEAA